MDTRSTGSDVTYRIDQRDHNGEETRGEQRENVRGRTTPNRVNIAAYNCAPAARPSRRRAPRHRYTNIPTSSNRDITNPPHYLPATESNTSPTTVIKGATAAEKHENEGGEREKVEVEMEVESGEHE
jgi:hypothetical protein